MRAGGGKQKGNSFENKIARILSEWITGGSRSDVFDRTASSGAKATSRRRHRSGDFSNQEGDILSVTPEGLPITEKFIIECKHHASIGMDSVVYEKVTKDENVMTWWVKLMEQCRGAVRMPMLIARQNRRPTLLFLSTPGIRYLSVPNELVTSTFRPRHNGIIYDINGINFDEFLEKVDPDLLPKYKPTRKKLRLT